MGASVTNARRLRATQTEAERRLWGALRNRSLAGLKLRRRHRIDRYVADFACIEARLVVEGDGATHSTAAELAHDRERTRIIEACGYLVLRVTNHDVLTNLDGVLSTILMQSEHRDFGWNA